MDKPKPARAEGRKGALHKRHAVSPPITGGTFPPERGIAMVTYGELFQLVLMITSIATLFYLIGRHTGKRK